MKDLDIYINVIINSDSVGIDQNYLRLLSWYLEY